MKDNAAPFREPALFAHRFLLLILAALLAGSAYARAFQSQSIGPVELSELPDEARLTLALVRKGGPFPHRKDGSVFGNFERRLPVKPRGHYREYTVLTPGARDRGARRIVAGLGITGDVRTSNEYYYTDDHYRTFRKISE